LADNPGTRQIPPRDMPPRKPWHVNGGDPLDPEAVSKRERVKKIIRTKKFSSFLQI